MRLVARDLQRSSRCRLIPIVLETSCSECQLHDVDTVDLLPSSEDSSLFQNFDFLNSQNRITRPPRLLFGKSANPSGMNDEVAGVQVSYLDIRQSDAVVIAEVDYGIAAAIRRLKH